MITELSSLSSDDSITDSSPLELVSHVTDLNLSMPQSN